MSSMLRARLMHSAKLTADKFLERLCENTRYDVQGEKPIAVIAAIKFLYHKNIVGLALSKIFATYKQNIRAEFLDLAGKFGRIKNPHTSFGVILGKNGELVRTVENNPEVDKAFSELTIDDIKYLYEKYLAKLSGAVGKIPVKEVTLPVALTGPVKEILGAEVTGEFYMLIRDFELSMREFIIEMIGKGWFNRLEKEVPHIVKKWKERREADDKMGIEPEKNLINYADITDYEQIMRRYKKIFF